MIKETVFQVGQTVVATCNYMHMITKGKQYTVVKYEESVRHEHFTWPAYVTVIGDFGEPVTGHTYRFKPVQEEDGK